MSLAELIEKVIDEELDKDDYDVLVDVARQKNLPEPTKSGEIKCGSAAEVKKVINALDNEEFEYKKQGMKVTVAGRL